MKGSFPVQHQSFAALIDDRNPIGASAPPHPSSAPEGPFSDTAHPASRREPDHFPHPFIKNAAMAGKIKHPKIHRPPSFMRSIAADNRINILVLPAVGPQLPHPSPPSETRRQTTPAPQKSFRCGKAIAGHPNGRAHRPTFRSPNSHQRRPLHATCQVLASIISGASPSPSKADTGATDSTAATTTKGQRRRAMRRKKSGFAMLFVTRFARGGILPVFDILPTPSILRVECALKRRRLK